MTLDVRCWHEADITWARRGVRFQGESGHDADWMSLPSLTLNRHQPALHCEIAKSISAPTKLLF